MHSTHAVESKIIQFVEKRYFFMRLNDGDSIDLTRSDKQPAGDQNKCWGRAAYFPSYSSPYSPKGYCCSATRAHYDT